MRRALPGLLARTGPALALDDTALGRWAPVCPLFELGLRLSTPPQLVMLDAQHSFSSPGSHCRMSTTAACSSCSQPLPDDGAFCAHCGNQVGDAEKTVLAVRRIREGTSTGQAQCQSCNSLLGVRDVFCRFCGARDRDMARSDAPAEEPGPDLMKERLAEATGDEFEIIKRLGKGGMGSVYLARESALQRFVAIKVLAPEFLADETLLERFRTEARIVATLRHRSIVGIHAVRHSVDLHYFVTD